MLWQSKPVPAQTLFRQKIGYGHGVPWSEGAPVDYDVKNFPRTVALLESSVVLFSQTYPIASQPLDLAEAYGDAFAKVWGRLGEVIDHAARQGGGAATRRESA